MMMDGKGCALVVALIAVAGLIVGLLLYWVGLAPWWAPLAGLAVGPGAFIAFAALLAIQAAADRARSSRS